MAAAASISWPRPTVRSGRLLLPANHNSIKDDWIKEREREREEEEEEVVFADKCYDTILAIYLSCHTADRRPVSQSLSHSFFQEYIVRKNTICS